MLVPKLRFKREDGTEYPAWEKKEIGNLLSLCHGKDYKHLGNGNIPVMGTGGIISYVDKALCDWECVCIGRKGTIDRPYYMNKPFWSVDTLFYSKPKKDNLPKFQYFLFQNINWQYYNEASGVPSLSASTIEKIRVNIPCLEEQQKIADFLTSVDEVIAQSEAEVQNLEQQKKAAMQKIFSQEVRFKREDGTEYPEWSKMKLNSILCEYKETCEKDGTYEHISLTKEGVVPKSERYERDFLVTDDSKKYRVTHLDDICYNPANLKFGVICRNKYGDGIFSPIYVTFKVQGDYLPIFVEMIVTREDFIKYALRFQQGTVYERMAVSPEDLLSITVNVPCLEEQQKIADFLSAYDEAISYAKQELEHWKQFKKGMLQQMFV